MSFGHHGMSLNLEAGSHLLLLDQMAQGAVQSSSPDQHQKNCLAILPSIFGVGLVALVGRTASTLKRKERNQNRVLGKMRTTSDREPVAYEVEIVLECRITMDQPRNNEADKRCFLRVCLTFTDAASQREDG